VPVLLPNQIKPPQAPRPPSRPNAISFLTMAVFGLIIGVTVQELRWRFSVMVPQSSLAQAEHEFKAGKDPAALKLFNTLADKNNPVAQYWLGHMTELGLGVPHDPAKAIDLYKKAAAQNVDAAELRLGEIYLDGDLVPPDFAQAKTYLEKSAYQGNSRAAMLLGQMYRAGIGMKADPTEGYAWSEVATLEGNVFAERERDASFHDLSPDDQKTAVTRAGEILKTVKSETPQPKVPQPKVPESK
jgi:TPR repeat protein